MTTKPNPDAPTQSQTQIPTQIPIEIRMRQLDVRAGIAARDELRLQAVIDENNFISTFRLSGSGCPHLVARLERVRAQMKSMLPLSIESMAPPSGIDHVSILFRELFLRARSAWAPPYTDLEICHCRSVPTARVDQAIVCGSHTIQQIARETSAGTSCGTCRRDTESMIHYRLSI